MVPDTLLATAEAGGPEQYGRQGAPGLLGGALLQGTVLFTLLSRISVDVKKVVATNQQCISNGCLRFS